ncbi:hypothetical protein [Bacteroides oleiciplenus]|uniref:Uncharacterized protein n=1 Tax=Bacteroides oleiciplenus YIT 12058 TaxID=742727 RepID=K9E4T6_9BACE|nr:hypothetical protein [Bacteroides oleiciplenus]EKU92149.1 hypothetical protein HMPREF9447_00599 [Bacteroides oleiciplenus YIT 12058]
MNLQDFYQITSYLNLFLNGAQPFIKDCLREHGGKVSMQLNGDEELNDENFPVCAIFEGRHDRPYIRITSVYLNDDMILVSGYDDETGQLRTGFRVYDSSNEVIIKFLWHVLGLETTVKASKTFEIRRDALKAEMIDCIKSALPQNGEKLYINKDQFDLTVAYNVDCECSDELNFLYISGESVTASLYNEPENEMELESFHEKSLIDIIDYLERHGYIRPSERQAQ